MKNELHSIYLAEPTMINSIRLADLEAQFYDDSKICTGVAISSVLDRG